MADPSSEVNSPEVTAAEQKEIIQPESVSPATVKIGDREVSIRALTRRWQSLFLIAGWPVVQAKLSGIEAIMKSAMDNTALITNWTQIIGDAMLNADKNLDRAPAVILASQVPGSSGCVRGRGQRGDLTADALVAGQRRLGADERRGDGSSREREA